MLFFINFNWFCCLQTCYVHHFKFVFTQFLIILSAFECTCSMRGKKKSFFAIIFLFYFIFRMMLKWSSKMILNFWSHHHHYHSRIKRILIILSCTTQIFFFFISWRCRKRCGSKSELQKNIKLLWNKKEKKNVNANWISWTELKLHKTFNDSKIFPKAEREWSVVLWEMVRTSFIHTIFNSFRERGI